MKIGFIISMYDEIDQVLKNIAFMKTENCKIIVVQSDPKNQKYLLDQKIVDYYKLLPDIASSKDSYNEERKNRMRSTVPARALTRNFSIAFSESKTMDIDWWVTILGDVSITNLNGIKKIIQIMTQNNKMIGFTRAVGQIFVDYEGNKTRIQRSDTTDFMPQFFIVKSNLIQDDLFNSIELTNPYASEQCLGDEIKRYCSKKEIKFTDICYSICDYAYPQFIDGLKYNPDRIRMPRYVDGIINKLRKWRVSLS